MQLGQRADTKETNHDQWCDEAMSRMDTERISKIPYIGVQYRGHKSDPSLACTSKLFEVNMGHDKSISSGPA